MIDGPVSCVNCAYTVKSPEKHKKKPETRKQVRLKDDRTEDSRIKRKRNRVDN